MMPNNSLYAKFGLIAAFCLAVMIATSIVYLISINNVILKRVKLNTEPSIILDVEVADNFIKRSKGLKNRTDLPDQFGMLFTYPDEAIRTFWMKDTPLSLDIIFIDKNNEVVFIHKAAIPNSPEPISSNLPSSKVLELLSGKADEYNLVKGIKIEIVDG